MTWFRVYFRRPKGATWGSPFPELLVKGEEERDRVLARPRPKAVFSEVAELHTCSTCETSAPWQPGWTWFGSDNDLESGKPIRKFCSRSCRPAEREDERRPEGVAYSDWPKTSTFEPDPTGERWKRWGMIRDLADPSAHRKVPMPDWPGPGSCRWCLKPTYWESGKRLGQPAKRNWHNDCYYRYELHTKTATQYDFLLERDGPRCAICAAGGYKPGGTTVDKPDGMTWPQWFELQKDPGAPGRYTILKAAIVLEVDHIIPLWKSPCFGGTLTERRVLFGPGNLWLLCVDCHKAKTALEAAERAAAKRAI